MKAICWYGKKDVRVENVPEPKLLNKRDAIVKTTLTAICGSDLHLYHGVIPTMEARRHPRPRVHGRSGRSGDRSSESEERRSRRGSVLHCLRKLLLLPEHR